jgi:hypothetical protein
VPRPYVVPEGGCRTKKRPTMTARNPSHNPAQDTRGGQSHTNLTHNHTTRRQSNAPFDRRIDQRTSRRAGAEHSMSCTRRRASRRCSCGGGGTASAGLPARVVLRCFLWGRNGGAPRRPPLRPPASRPPRATHHHHTLLLVRPLSQLSIT